MSLESQEEALSSVESDSPCSNANRCQNHEDKNSKYVRPVGHPLHWTYFCSSCAIEMAQSGEKLIKIKQAKGTPTLLICLGLI
jgi:MinD superfamily P-loop ATPase